MIKNHQKTLNRIHVIIDLVMVVVAYALAYGFRFLWLKWIPLFYARPGTYLEFRVYMSYLWAILPGYLIILLTNGVYRPQRSSGRFLEIMRIVKLNCIGIFYIMTLLFLVKEINISRWFLVFFFLLNVVLELGYRFVLRRTLRKIRKEGYNIKHVLLVGYSRTAEGLLDRMQANPHWGYHVIGILDDMMETGTRYKGIPVIGPLSSLEQQLEDYDLDEINITMRMEDYTRLSEIVAVCEKSGVHTKFLPDYQDIIPTIPYMEDLEGLPVVHIRKVPLASSELNRFLKRAMDLVFGSIALLIAAIPMAVVAVIIKCTSRGPVLYTQKRVGYRNKEFLMYKFRSMELQEESKEKTAWTTFKDPRVTPIGKFIRKTSIDELPQLWNVLKGDMSLVGPRPERPFYVEKFKEEIPRYMVKHQVRPGMTGWAQVNGYRGDTSIRKRIDYDLYYIENWTPGFDILIMFLTVFKGFINKNAY
ncbi:MAG: undecaprenyl-phosphate glucose phosphotransferase [Lachnospiraceae bacterium]|nr:undecaprenyl-phosphate glucose phosphotransferase [Lachnospiraceae bacterium]